MATDYPLVYIEWEDSYGCSSEWTDIRECNVPEQRCVSVGFLIHADKQRVVVVPHLSLPRDDGDDCGDPRQDGCGDMTIPRSAIRRIRTLSAGRSFRFSLAPRLAQG
jgi:hypothetical protein